jgi:hypothetical protein
VQLGTIGMATMASRLLPLADAKNERNRALKRDGLVNR